MDFSSIDSISCKCDFHKHFPCEEITPNGCVRRFHRVAENDNSWMKLTPRLISLGNWLPLSCLKHMFSFLKTIITRLFYFVFTLWFSQRWMFIHFSPTVYNGFRNVKEKLLFKQRPSHRKTLWESCTFENLPVTLGFYFNPDFWTFELSLESYLKKKENL